MASGMLEETGEDDGRLVLSYPIEVKSPAIAVYVMLKASRATSSCWRQQTFGPGEDGSDSVGKAREPRSRNRSRLEQSRRHARLPRS